MKPNRSILTIAILALCAFIPPAAAQTPAARAATKKLAAVSFDSGFAQAHTTFNGMLAASDGKIYYVLCSASIDTGAQMYSFDPKTSKIQHLGDLTEASGEKGLKTIPQGKSHVNFVEWKGKLYFASHLGYYSTQGGVEKAGVPKPGYKPYPGGHFLAYDMASGKLENVANAPEGQGIIDFSMDGKRGRLYGLTWPNGNFLRYDLATKNLKNLGPITKEGEAGNGPTYRILCRALPVDSEDGSVYMTTADGDILRYRYDTDALETVQGENMRKDYFGTFNVSNLRMGYNWRQAFWDPAEKAVIGLHGTSGYVFRFDPRVPRVDVLERVTSEPSKRSGMGDEFAYGYLSFCLGPDGRTVYYLTTGPILGENGKRLPRNAGARGALTEDLRLVTYDIPAAKYEDHGAIFLPDGQTPTVVHSIAVAKGGAVYFMGTFRRGGRQISDLIRVQVK